MHVTRWHRHNQPPQTRWHGVGKYFLYKSLYVLMLTLRQSIPWLFKVSSPAVTWPSGLGKASIMCGRYFRLLPSPCSFIEVTSWLHMALRIDAIKCRQLKPNQSITSYYCKTVTISGRNSFIIFHSIFTDFCTTKFSIYASVCARPVFSWLRWLAFIYGFSFAALLDAAIAYFTFMNSEARLWARLRN